MSAGFLQGIRLKVERLNEAVVEASRLDVRVELTGEREVVLEAIEAKQGEVASAIQKIRDALSAIQRDVDRWLEYMKGLAGEVHAAEMKVYTAEVASGESYVQAVDEGEAAYSQLKRNLEQLEASGEVLEFKPFWDTFAATIDSQSFSKMEKLAYLKGVLRGEAFRAVDGYPMTEESYDVIKKVLCERFDNEEFIVHKLYNELDVIPRSGNGVREARQVYERLEKVIRMLEAYGQDVEQTHIGVVYTRRMPYWVTTRIHERKSGRDDWSELVAFMDGDGPRNEQRHEQRQKGPKQGLQRAGVFAVQSHQEVSPKQGSGGYSPSCVYCNGSYYSDQCQKRKSIVRVIAKPSLANAEEGITGRFAVAGRRLERHLRPVG
ncbi:gag protein [Aphelenchoides avenae]|nr:gag protein [Aphelenchus avenae]